MADEDPEIAAWLGRIGCDGPCAATLPVLQKILAAHAMAIPYETIDPLLGRPPSLDLADLRRKMIHRRRGGYCFEQNMLLRAGLHALGFKIVSLQARVVRNLPMDAERPAFHMVLRVDLPEGPFLADVGLGNLAPTAPLALRPYEEQETPHEPMRFVPFGDELVLQARLGETWEHIYRVVLLPRVDAEYEIGNWFAATHPGSAFANNLIAARPGADRTRLTLFNDRLVTRQVTGEAERRLLRGPDQLGSVLSGLFGLDIAESELRAIFEEIRRKGAGGDPHPFFT